MYPEIFVIPSYSLFASIGLFTMMVLTYYRSKRIDMAFKRMLFLIGCEVIGAGLGSKLLFIITQIPKIINDFTLHNTLYIIATSGFVFYGGLFGAIVGTVCFARYYKYDLCTIFNIVTPGFAAFHMWGRIGCFFAGCCYGKPAQWGFALYREPDVLRIPIQLIESACILMILCILLIVEKRSRGSVKILNVYLGLYASCRFILEFWRGDEVRGIWFGLSTSQIISILILIVLCIKAIGNCIHSSRV